VPAADDVRGANAKAARRRRRASRPLGRRTVAPRLVRAPRSAGLQRASRALDIQRPLGRKTVAPRRVRRSTNPPQVKRAARELTIQGRSAKQARASGANRRQPASPGRMLASRERHAQIAQTRPQRLASLHPLFRDALTAHHHAAMTDLAIKQATVPALLRVSRELDRAEAKQRASRPVSAAGINLPFTAGDAGRVLASARSGAAFLGGAVVKQLGGGTAPKFLTEMGANAGRDVVDLATNAIPSTYHLAATTVHDPRAGAKMLAQPYIDLGKNIAKGDVKKIAEHPLQNALLVSGGYGALGRGLGGAARIGGKAGRAGLREVGSTLRPAATVELPGTTIRAEGRYSPNLLTKAVQRRNDVRRVAQPNRLSDRMLGRDTLHREIRTRTNENRAMNEDLRRYNRSAAQQIVHEAVAPPKRIIHLPGNRRVVVGRRHPNAAVTLATQNIVHPTRAAVSDYLLQLEHEHTAMKAELGRIRSGDKVTRRNLSSKIAQNEATRKEIRASLRSFDEGNVREAAEHYAKASVDLENGLVTRGMVTRDTAERARLTPYAVQHMGARVLTGKDVRAHVESLRTALRDAQAEVRRQEAVVEGSLAGAGVARGRAAILSRQVGGTQAERRAEARTVDPAKGPQFAGGGYGVQQASAGLRAARAHLETARERVKEIKAQIAEAPKLEGKFVAHGQELTPADIRAHMQHRGLSEPAFVTQKPPGRRASSYYVPRVQSITDPLRTGEATRVGTFEAHPSVLYDQAAKSQGLIDAHDGYRSFASEFGYRKGGKLVVRSAADQRRLAQQLQQETGVAWRPVKLVPFGAKKDQIASLVTDPHKVDVVKDVSNHLREALGDGGDQRGAYVLVPEVAAKTFADHLKGTGAHPVLSMMSSFFRQSVLGLSFKWLFGNTIEAALRSLVSGTRPDDYVFGKRVIRELEKGDPELARQIIARTVQGGHYSLAARNSLHASGEQFAGSDLAGIATALGKFRRLGGARHVADGWNHYTHLVFQSVNGRLETQFQTAMLGRALRKDPLMSDRLLMLSDKAVRQAAEGLTHTEAQIRFGREIDRMYGKYGKWSPSMRHAIASYTPFIAWSLNALRFLFDVLPRDHPVLTSALASASQATEDWRKQVGMETNPFKVDAGKPRFLQGGIPNKQGGVLRLSRYTPFGITANEGGIYGTLMDSLLPQFSGFIAASKGEDWKGAPLNGPHTKSSDAQNMLAGIVSAIEAMVPGVTLAATATGTKLPSQAKGTKIPETLSQRLNKYVNPFIFTAPYTPKTRSATNAGGGVLLRGGSSDPLVIAP
jgi:hypothetical protein